MLASYYFSANSHFPIYKIRTIQFVAPNINSLMFAKYSDTQQRMPLKTVKRN